MAEIKTEPVRAQRVNDIDSDDVPPGAFEFFTSGDRTDAGMIFACPCGCGQLGSLSFRPEPSPSWDWDGNREQPTLLPSVHRVGHWHGWLQGGVWTSC
ncbi:MAG TPA: DUF6527 family protein [Devosiaceae bacterium]|jgi:hypothetical protein|nr:DUF6527 family protein [Devosiaceae bacterium]